MSFLYVEITYNLYRTTMNTPYGISLFDDLHNYCPDILYNQDPNRFPTTQSILQYIRGQLRSHMDVYSRNQNLYNQQNPVVELRTPPHVPRIPLYTRPIIETVELEFPTPQERTAIDELFNYNSINTRIPTSLANLSSTFLLTELYNSLQTPLRNQTSVIVRPSMAQIEQATALRQASGEQDDFQCSICQDVYTDGQAIRTIRHCNHSFHKTCIDPWFQRNVRCPVCRFDIRDTASP